MQIGDHLAFNSPPHDVPRMGAFDLVTDADAAGAEYAAIMIDTKQIVRRIHGVRFVAIRYPYVIHPAANGQVLQLAMSIGDADRADMVAFRE